MEVGQRGPMACSPQGAPSRTKACRRPPEAQRSASAINTEGEATMKPRHVTVLLMIALGAVLAPRVADAQAPTKVARIGWMSRGNPTASDPAMDAFRQGMRELGYVEGQTFVMEPRYAGGKSELMPEQAAELERAGVDVIIAGPFEALQAAKQSTSRVPIIMTPSADPVATGIVKSLDHPGGTITGITEMMPELTPQRLNLLKQIVPTLSRVAILWRPGTLSEDTFKHMLQETQATARSIGVHIQVVEAAKVEDFDAAFSAMATGARRRTHRAGQSDVQRPATTHYRACGEPQAARHLRVETIRPRWRAHLLWSGCPRYLPPGGRIRRQDPQGR